MSQGYDDRSQQMIRDLEYYISIGDLENGVFCAQALSSQLAVLGISVTEFEQEKITPFILSLPTKNISREVLTPGANFATVPNSRHSPYQGFPRVSQGYIAPGHSLIPGHLPPASIYQEPSLVPRLIMGNRHNPGSASDTTVLNAPVALRIGNPPNSVINSRYAMNQVSGINHHQPGPGIPLQANPYNNEEKQQWIGKLKSIGISQNHAVSLVSGCNSWEEVENKLNGVR